MGKIKIIADSTCDITKEEAKRYNIDIIPLKILWDDKSYKDWYDFEPNEFYNMFYQTQTLPTTSQPVPEDFLQAYQRAAADGYEIILVMTINSLASGTYQSAVIARETFCENHGKNIKIKVIDSGTYSYLLGATVVHAAALLEDGKDFESVLKIIDQRFARVKAHAIVDTLEFLKRSGRISGFTNFVGSFLDVKPIINVENRKVESYDKARGHKKSFERLLELVEKDIDLDFKEMCLIVGDMPNERDELMTILQEKFPGFKIVSRQIGSVITIHGGPKLIGVMYYKKI